MIKIVSVRVCVCVCMHTLTCISVILFLPHPPSSTQGLIKTRMHQAASSSVSSPDFFLLNPPRKSPEVFEVLGCVNKDVTTVDTGLLNEDTRFDVRTLQCPKERDALQQTLPFSPSLSCFFVFLLQGPNIFFSLLYFLFCPQLSRRKGINERKCRENAVLQILLLSMPLFLCPI